jgi:transcriptional regulator with XRE-family HTH domain
MSERADDIEVRRALKLLEALIKAHGLTKKALDQKLRKGPGYISQVLTGRLELKYRHILEILGALELDPGLFFRALFLEPERPTESGRMMEKFLESLQIMGYTGERMAAGDDGSVAADAGGPGDPGRHRGAPAGAPAGVDPDDLDRRIRAAIAEALAERTTAGSEPGGAAPAPPGHTESAESAAGRAEPVGSGRRT